MNDGVESRSFARLRSVFRAVFDDESLDLSEATVLGTVAGWDRARHLEPDRCDRAKVRRQIHNA